MIQYPLWYYGTCCARILHRHPHVSVCQKGPRQGIQQLYNPCWLLQYLWLHLAERAMEMMMMMKMMMTTRMIQVLIEMTVASFYISPCLQKFVSALQSEFACVGCVCVASSAALQNEFACSVRLCVESLVSPQRFALLAFSESVALPKVASPPFHLVAWALLACSVVSSERSLECWFVDAAR